MLLDTELPYIDRSSEEFNHICRIITKHEVHSHIRVRQLHRHRTIPEGHILLGTRISKPLGYWVRPTPIVDIDLHKICPHILSVDVIDCAVKRGRESLLLPSEFREGPPINIDHSFVTEFTNFVREEGLERKYGLEVIEGQPKKMIEFSFDSGSILIEEDEVTSKIKEAGCGEFTLRDTSWAVTVEGGLVDQTGETRCVTYTTGHIQVKNEPVKSVSDVVNALREGGFLGM